MVVSLNDRIGGILSILRVSAKPRGDTPGNIIELIVPTFDSCVPVSIILN